MSKDKVDEIIKGLQYIPKVWTALSYPILLLVALFLFFGRNYQMLQLDLLVNMLPTFYNHVSNFSMSLIIYITMGYIGLMMGLTKKQLLLLGLIIILFNLIIEMFVSILNTPDLIDASYGICGVLIGLLYLLIIKAKGLRLNDVTKG